MLEELITEESVTGMQLSPESTPVANRAARRKQLRRGRNQRGTLLGRVGIVHADVYSSAILWNQQVAKANDLSQRIHTYPSVYEFAEVRRKLPGLLQEIQSAQAAGGVDINKTVLDNFAHNNLYEENVKGTSLLDIERMPLPLDSQDIRRINEMFRINAADINVETDEQRVTRIMMIMLASQNMAWSDKPGNIPESVRPLQERLVAYFDFYTQLFVSPTDDLWEEHRFLRSLYYTGGLLSLGIGIFLPARLGILPSSAIKIYERHKEVSAIRSGSFINLNWLVDHRFWDPLLKNLRKASLNAHRPHNLPEDLMQFQEYDPQKDKEASLMLRKFYEISSLGEQDIEGENSISKQLIDRLLRYQEAVHVDLFRVAKRNRWNLGMPEGHVISEVIVTSQNKDVLILILKFEGSGTHLTLEFDKSGRVFGFPADISKKFPYVQNQVVTDVLEPFLDRARTLFPSIEPVQRIETDKLRQVVPEVKPVEDTPKPVESGYAPRASAERPVRSKRPTVLTPIALYFLQKGSDLPKPHQEFGVPERREYTLRLLNNLHPSQEDIAEFISKQTARFNDFDGSIYSDITTAVSSLKEAPYGPGSSKLHNDWESIRTDGVNNRRMLKWRLRLDQRFDLSSTRSKELRVVYVPLKDSVVLLSVSRHGDQEYPAGRGIRI